MLSDDEIQAVGKEAARQAVRLFEVFPDKLDALFEALYIAGFEDGREEAMETRSEWI